MAQNITLWGASYPDVPACLLPKTGGGTARFTDVSDTTAAASDVASGKYFYDANGTRTLGTNSGGGGSMVIQDEPDSHGGTIRHITAGSVVQGTINITSNGTVDVSAYASAEVSVGGGASGYTFIASASYAVNTTSTSGITVGTLSTGDTSIWTSDKMVYVKIRDEAGIRNNYLYGADVFLYNWTARGYPSGTSTYTICGNLYKGSSNGATSPMAIVRSTNYQPNGPGIWPSMFYSNGDIDIKARYSSSDTGTIDGTFAVSVYLLDWPGGIGPWQE